MAYNLMKTVIRLNKKTKDQLTKMANVYYAAGQFNSEDEYLEIMETIAAL